MQGLFNRYRARELNMTALAKEAARYMKDDDRRTVYKRISNWITRKKIKPGQAQTEIIDDPNRKIYVPT